MFPDVLETPSQIQFTICRQQLQSSETAANVLHFQIVLLQDEFLTIKCEICVILKFRIPDTSSASQTILLTLVTNTFITNYSPNSYSESRFAAHFCYLEQCHTR